MWPFGCFVIYSKAGRGGLKDTSALDLLTTVLKGIVDQVVVIFKLPLNVVMHFI